MFLHHDTFFQYGLFTKETGHDNQFLNLFWRQNILSAQTSFTVDTTPYILLQLMMGHTYYLPIDCNFTIITVTSNCWWMEQLKFICMLLLLLLLLSHLSRVRLMWLMWLMWPHRRQPMLPHPWDSPGKNTQVGCHFLLQCMKVKSESEVTQSCPILLHPMDCSPPSSSIHGIFQATELEWSAIAFSGLYAY